MMATEIHVEPTYYHGHCTKGTHGNEKKSRILEVVIVVHRKQDGESRDGDADGEYCEKEAMLKSIGDEGDEHCKQKSANPRRDGVELSLDGGVVVCFNNRRSEECVTWWDWIVRQRWIEHCGGCTVGRDDETEVHETSKDDLDCWEISSLNMKLIWRERTILEHVNHILKLDFSLYGALSLINF